MTTELALQNLQSAVDTRFTGTKNEIIALDQSLLFLKNTIEAQKIVAPKPEDKNEQS